MFSEFGKIAEMLQEPKKELTPLQQKLNLFSKQLGLITIILMALFAITGILLGESATEIFLTAVSLAVAAIPEGLAATITIGLAFAVKRMAKVKTLIRKLPAAETLGRVTVICSDKTGTITKEELSVTKIFCNNKTANIDDKFLYYLENTNEAKLLMKIAVLSSNARLESTKKDGKENLYIVGDGTEKALLKIAHRYGFDKEFLARQEPRIKEFSFTSKRKMMTIVRKEGNKAVSYSKGSPEAILNRCKKELVNGKLRELNDERRKYLIKEYEKLASDALRVMAFAYKIIPRIKEEISEEEAEYGLTFVGFQAMFDAPREEVKDAIGKCKKAGISVKIITGDSLITARAVAKQIGLEGKAIQGHELKVISDDNLEKIIDEIVIFARADPEDKVRIVSLLKKRREIVALTGDGVNDAPALRKADIGIAMGVRGSDVTRDVADMILLDDNFASIVNSVQEGRKVYDNIKRFTYYLLSTNLAEVSIIFAALVIGSIYGWSALLPLLPLQILWVNLVSDGLIAITLSRAHSERNIMNRKPERADIMNSQIFGMLILISLFITIPVLYFFANNQSNLIKAQTISFTLLVFFEGFNAFNFSSFIMPVYMRRKNYLLMIAVASTFLLQLALLYIPFMQRVFHTTALSLNELLVLGFVSASILLLGETYKIFTYKRRLK